MARKHQAEKLLRDGSYPSEIAEHMGIRPRKHDSYHVGLRPSELAEYKDRWEIIEQAVARPAD